MEARLPSVGDGTSWDVPAHCSEEMEMMPESYSNMRILCDGSTSMIHI